MILLTEASVGKYFHTYTGSRVTVLSKHPRKDFFEVQAHDCDPSYWVTAAGDHDLTGQGKPDKRDLISPTDGKLLVTIESQEELEIIPDREDCDAFYFTHLDKKYYAGKTSWKVFCYTDRAYVGTARLP
jgi:hypothetical protein